MTGIDHSVQQVREQVRIWRRRLIAGAIVFVVGLMALSQFVVAARLSLEVAMGPIGSRVFVGAMLSLIVLAVALATWKFESNSRQTEEQRDKVGSIVDAISLGYVFAQDLKAAAGFSRDKPKSNEPDKTTAETAGEGAAKKTPPP